MLLNLKYRKDLEGMSEILTKMGEWKKEIVRQKHNTG